MCVSCPWWFDRRTRAVLLERLVCGVVQARANGMMGSAFNSDPVPPPLPPLSPLVLLSGADTYCINSASEYSVRTLAHMAVGAEQVSVRGRAGATASSDGRAGGPTDPAGPSVRGSCVHPPSKGACLCCCPPGLLGVLSVSAEGVVWCGELTWLDPDDPSRSLPVGRRPRPSTTQHPQRRLGTSSEIILSITS